ncbi:MAG: transporter [Pseudanabaena sp.]|jgi:hyperosmotically inducible protein|nr:MAG: transporter [Pseudanabaena sp.]
MNTKIASLFLANLVVVLLVSCTEAKTTAEAPAPSATSASSPSASPQNTQAAMADAQSETRQKQLDADIRAREQRNNMTGGTTTRADSDLVSEVRSKLEANIPKGNLTVESKDSNVIVSGTVSSLDELDKVKSLATEIKGVKTVTIKATVASKQ